MTNLRKGGKGDDAVEIIEGRIALNDLYRMAEGTFGDLVKAVVDVDRELIALDAELHADLEAFLLQSGSKQSSLWGINLYPEMRHDGFIEFDSVINIRPSQGNRSRGVESDEIRRRIVAVVEKRIEG